MYVCGGKCGPRRSPGAKEGEANGSFKCLLEVKGHRGTVEVRVPTAHGGGVQKHLSPFTILFSQNEGTQLQISID